jgi:gamma-butyrobetaine dioxygenase
MWRPEAWQWEATSGPSRLAEAMAGPGVAVLDLPAGLRQDLSRAPQAAAETLTGEVLLAVERQPIRPLPGGRTFATSAGPAPFHTDSQRLDGTPPHLQMMLCVRAPASGGQNCFLDGWALLDRVRGEDPALHAALFGRPRRMPFVFGDVMGPTVALRGDSLVFTQPARALAGDEVAEQLAPHLARAPVLELSPSEGQLIVIHNHRWLHGRAGFDDPSREFLRLLAWRRRPYPAPAHHLAEATAARDRLARQLHGQPADVLRRAGLSTRLTSTTEPAPPAAERLAVVLEMLRGTPPGQLARRLRVPEDELYRWREALLGAALHSLEDAQLGTREDHERRTALALGLPPPPRPTKETP